MFSFVFDDDSSKRKHRHPPHFTFFFFFHHSRHYHSLNFQKDYEIKDFNYLFTLTKSKMSHVDNDKTENFRALYQNYQTLESAQ